MWERFVSQSQTFPACSAQFKEPPANANFVSTILFFNFYLLTAASQWPLDVDERVLLLLVAWGTRWSQWGNIELPPIEHRWIFHTHPCDLPIFQLNSTAALQRLADAWWVMSLKFVVTTRDERWEADKIMTTSQVSSFMSLIARHIPNAFAPKRRPEELYISK